jgi:hypothetical protein
MREVRRGASTTVVELQDQVPPPFDEEMTTPIAEPLGDRRYLARERHCAQSHRKNRPARGSVVRSTSFFPLNSCRSIDRLPPVSSSNTFATVYGTLSQLTVETLGSMLIRETSSFRYLSFRSDEKISTTTAALSAWSLSWVEMPCTVILGWELTCRRKMVRISPASLLWQITRIR